MREIWITIVEYVDGTHEEYEDITLTMHDSGNVVMITSNIENEKMFIPLNNVKRIVGIKVDKEKEQLRKEALQKLSEDIFSDSGD